MNFSTWTDPLAYAVCSMSNCSSPQSWCYNLTDENSTKTRAITNIAALDSSLAWLTFALQPWHDSLVQMSHKSKDSSNWAAYRLCTWVTWVETIPWLALLFVACVSVFVLTQTVLDIILLLLNLMGQVHAYHHTE